MQTTHEFTLQHTTLHRPNQHTSYGTKVYTLAVGGYFSVLPQRTPDLHACWWVIDKSRQGLCGWDFALMLGVETWAWVSQFVESKSFGARGLHQRHTVSLHTQSNGSEGVTGQNTWLSECASTVAQMQKEQDPSASVHLTFSYTEASKHT